MLPVAKLTCGNAEVKRSQEAKDPSLSDKLQKGSGIITLTQYKSVSKPPLGNWF